MDPKSKIAGPHQSHVELMEAEVDKLHPNHPNGEQSEGAQKERKVMGSDEEVNR